MNTISCGRTGFGRLVLIALPVIYLAVGCSPEATPHADVVRPVKTTVVAAGGEPRARSFPGVVEASRKAELAFLVPGVLVNFPVTEGQRVAKGQLIAQLRQDEFQAQLRTLQGQLDQARAALQALRAGERPEQRQRLEAQLRAAEAELANARSDYERHARLLRSNAISRAAYERTRTAYRVAQENQRAARQALQKGMVARPEEIEAQQGVVRGLEARVVEANIQLEDSTLRAPYDGVIAQRFVEVRQNVRAQEPIVRFQDVDEINIAMDVPETVMASEIRSADIVQLLAEFSGAPGRQFPVHITEVAQTADPTTQTFRVRATMKVPPEVNLLPGMTATVALTYRRAGILDNRILVPVSAVFKDSTGQQVVWVIGSDQKVSRRPVKIGAPTGGQIEIVDGLQPDERIAVAGVSFLRDGMQVRDLGDALGGV